MPSRVGWGVLNLGSFSIIESISASIRANCSLMASLRLASSLLRCMRLRCSEVITSGVDRTRFRGVVPLLLVTGFFFISNAKKFSLKYCVFRQPVEIDKKKGTTIGKIVGVALSQTQGVGYCPTQSFRDQDDSSGIS